MQYELHRDDWGYIRASWLCELYAINAHTLIPQKECGRRTEREEIFLYFYIEVQTNGVDLIPPS